jgi:branched-chain amino acid transport system ATP-binding protein
VFDTLAALRAEGLTILLVEQSAARAIDFADRSYVLRSGRVVATGTREELLATADLADLYLGLGGRP